MLTGMVESRSKIYQKSRESSDENHKQLIKEIEKEIQKLGGDPGLFDVQKILEPLLAAIKDRNFDFSKENRKLIRSRDENESDDDDGATPTSNRDFIPAEIKDIEEENRRAAEKEARDRAKRLEEALREAEEKSEAKVGMLKWDIVPYLVRLTVCLSVFPSHCLSVCVSVCVSLCLSVRLSVCLSVCMYV